MTAAAEAARLALLRELWRRHGPDGERLPG